MLLYSPSLRFKQGEYRAVARISRDVKSHVEPCFIIPPPKEHDPEKGRPLTACEVAYFTGERIGKHWPLRRAYLDPQYMLQPLGSDGLLHMFQSARARNAMLVSVATASQLHNPVWRDLLLDEAPRFALRVPFGDINEKLLVEGLQKIDCHPKDCVIFVDFEDSELNPEIAVPVANDIIYKVAEIAPWYRIIFQGSAYPATNPAEEGENALVPRNEWLTFQEILDSCSIPTERLGYSDFGADCAKIKFPKGGGGRPIRHIRYTSEQSTLVIRGPSTGTHAEAMTDVLSRLISSDHFSGERFSYADRRMRNAAKGDSTCGNPSMWREWNMAHHVTKVVRDLGRRYGIEFADLPQIPESEQALLFPVSDE